MIIHHREDLSTYKLSFQRPLKYTSDFSFVPIRIGKPGEKSEKNILQTPLLFAPYGLQTRGPNQKQKQTLDVSFMNRENDPYVETFLDNLHYLMSLVKEKFSKRYVIHDFLKTSTFDECMRLKVSPTMRIFDPLKNPLETISSFSYGTFLIDLHGLWISGREIWFQWYVVQSKIIEPVCMSEYQFIDRFTSDLKDEKDTKEDRVGPSIHEGPDKYEKMLKMGVPREAVERQRSLDAGPGPGPGPNLRKRGPPPPPPPPPPHMESVSGDRSSRSEGLKIHASELRAVTLKSSSERKVRERRPQAQGPLGSDEFQENSEMGYFEPPSLGDIQSMLKKLKPVSTT